MFSEDEAVAPTAAKTQQNLDSLQTNANKPFFVAVGHGTTGTTTLFKAMCNLGVPGVHWDQYCVKWEKGTADGDVGASIADGLRAQGRIVRWFYDLKNCAVNSRKQNKALCPDLDFERSNLRLLEDLRVLVKSDLVFASDTPHSYIFPQLLKVAKQEGRDVVLVLTEREPTEWARSRMAHHPGASDVMCDDVEHAFDLEACIQKERDVTKLLFHHREMGQRKNATHTKLSENTEYKDFLISALKKFHRTIKNQERTVNINFWNEDLREMEDIQPMLLARMAHYVLPSALAPYANNATTAFTPRMLKEYANRTPSGDLRNKGKKQ